MYLFREVLAFVERLCYKHSELLFNVCLPVMNNALIKRLIFEGYIQKEPHHLYYIS
jgi:hypothetical protein